MGAPRLQVSNGDGLMTVSPYADAVLADSPVGYWRLGEATGQTTAVARVGANATWVNGTSESVPGALLIAPKDNYASRFASTKYLNVANPKTVAGAGTIECWVNPAPWTVASRFGIWQNTTSWTVNAANTVSVFRYENNNFYFRLVGSDGVIYDIATTWTTWFNASAGYHHVACTYGAGAMALYINGTSVSSRTAVMPSTLPNATVQISRGHDGTGNGHNLDEFAIYDKALTATQVKAHYDASFIPPGITRWTDYGSRSAMVMG